MQRVKVFKSTVTDITDNNSLEHNFDLFVKDKEIISVTQSVTPKPGTEGKNASYFMVVTVVYDDKR